MNVRGENGGESRTNDSGHKIFKMPKRKPGMADKKAHETGNIIEFDNRRASKNKKRSVESAADSGDHRRLSEGMSQISTAAMSGIMDNLSLYLADHPTDADAQGMMLVLGQEFQSRGNDQKAQECFKKIIKNLNN